MSYYDFQKTWALGVWNLSSFDWTITEEHTHTQQKFTSSQSTLKSHVGWRNCKWRTFNIHAQTFVAISSNILSISSDKLKRAFMFLRKIMCMYISLYIQMGEGFIKILSILQNFGNPYMCLEDYCWQYKFLYFMFNYFMWKALQLYWL
jgi:hypothetical protein